MASAVKNYRELRVYTASVELAMQVFEQTRGWPPDEFHGLTDQARRSSRAVAVAIAGGWQKRRSPAGFEASLTAACASAEETCVWLDFANRCGYLDDADLVELADRCGMITGMLKSMIRRADRWCGIG